MGRCAASTDAVPLPARVRKSEKRRSRGGNGEEQPGTWSQLENRLENLAAVHVLLQGETCVRVVNIGLLLRMEFEKVGATASRTSGPFSRNGTFQLACQNRSQNLDYCLWATAMPGVFEPPTPFFLDRHARRT